MMFNLKVFTTVIITFGLSFDCHNNNLIKDITKKLFIKNW